MKRFQVLSVLALTLSINIAKAGIILETPQAFVGTSSHPSSFGSLGILVPVTVGPSAVQISGIGVWGQVRNSIDLGWAVFPAAAPGVTAALLIPAQSVSAGSAQWHDSPGLARPFTLSANATYWIGPVVSGPTNSFGQPFNFPGGQVFGEGVTQQWGASSNVRGPASNPTSDRVSGSLQSAIRLFGNTPPPVPIQQLGLAWGRNVPRAYTVVVDRTGNVSTVQSPGTTPAAVVGEATKVGIRQRLEKMFSDSGIGNVSIVDGFVAGGTNVYFADPLPGSSLLGKAFTGIDQFNANAAGSAVVFLTGDTELDAEVAGHEVGHTLGLRHVNPSAANDPTNLSLMDYDDKSGDSEMFVNAVSEITEPPNNPAKGTGLFHNPVYHLERYLDGLSHNDLLAQNIMPGDWDLLPSEGGSSSLVQVSLDFGEFDQQLYDVHILAGVSGWEEALTELASFELLSLSELEQLSWVLDAGTAVQLLAASSEVGDLDVILATGDPFDPSDHGVLALLGESPASLQLITDSEGGFVTLASTALHTVAIPEPSTFLLILAGLLGLACHRWRKFGVLHR